MENKEKNVIESMGETVTGAYKKIEDGVVGTYKKIEDGVVGAYKKVEDGFVEKFIARPGESVEDAKKRISGENE